MVAKEDMSQPQARKTVEPQFRWVEPEKMPAVPATNIRALWLGPEVVIAFGFPRLPLETPEGAADVDIPVEVVAQVVMPVERARGLYNLLKERFESPKEEHRG